MRRPPAAGVTMLDRLLLILALIAIVLTIDGAAAAEDDASLGRRLYREGILAAGQPATATVQPGLPLRGADAACTNCHRRSGFGTSEGYTSVRPITAPFLFEPDNVYQRRIQKNIGKAANAPAPYDDRSLLRALRAGVSASGRPLDGMMPHYDLGETDAANLLAYLKTLAAQPSPGVDATTLHFATIVDDAAEPAKSAAMLAILESFFRDKNGGTRLEGRRAAQPTWHTARIFEAYRTWKLHVWRLHGPTESWPAQLEAHYRAQPVFAVISGIGKDDWQPVQDFCERSELPCLLPNIPAPPPDASGFYSLYFSRGAVLEAEALAVHLDQATQGPMVQIRRDGDAAAEAAARAFRNRLPEPQRSRLSEYVLAADAPADGDFWRLLPSLDAAATLVLWLGPKDLESLALLPATCAPEHIYLSASLAGTPTPPAKLRQHTYVMYPYDLPERVDKRLLRLRAWLRAKGIAPNEEAIQANTFFAVNQVGEALMHMVDNFSRDYFIERIEHGLENSLAPSTYPHPSLGPDQRYVSKGSYILKYQPGPNAGLAAASDWIVP